MNVDQQGIWPFLDLTKIKETIRFNNSLSQDLHLVPFIYADSSPIFPAMIFSPHLQMLTLFFALSTQDTSESNYSGAVATPTSLTYHAVLYHVIPK